MAKKKTGNGYFNIFDVGDILAQPDEVKDEQPEENQKQYFSIANIVEESENIDDSAQLTMFNGENSEIAPNDEIFSAETLIDEDAFLDEEVEEIDESIITDEILEEVIDENITEEIAEEFFVEEIAAKEDETINESDEVVNYEPAIEKSEEEVKQLQEEETLVSMLETNMLDEEVAEEIVVNSDEEIQEETNNSFENIPDYKQIKKKKEFDSFETPYVYHGKNGDRIRYRLHLPTDARAKRIKNTKSILGWILTVVLALVFALFIRSYVFLVATVDGPSMQPTLTTNDRLFVTRFTYKLSDVERGDIVICKYDTPLYPDMYVKRVIALSGETVSVVDGVVCINGAPIYEDYTLPSTEDNRFYNMDPYEVPAGHVFVMGDNRNNSADSRSEIVGPISIDNIIGKAQVRIFPFTNIGLLGEDN